MDATSSRSYTTRLEARANGGGRVPVPFDPNEQWGTKRQHPVAGTVNGMGIRGTVTQEAGEWAFTIGAAWLRDCPVRPGDPIEVFLIPEGPQRADLAPDIAAALAANPAAAAFFDTLAQFYRKGYLRWIDGTKRRPEVRARRIAEVVHLLADGIKQRPTP
jgi:hypothetical protein